MIIDAHAHIYEYLRPYGPWGEGRAIGKGRLRWPDGREVQFFPAEYGNYGFPAESLLKVMEENKVDKAVLMQAQNYGFQNDYVAEIVRKYPDRFCGSCIFDPYARRAMDLFRYFVEKLHFRVLKFEMSEAWGLTGIHPDLALHSAVFMPVWEYAEANHVTVVVDPGVRNSYAWSVHPFLRVKQRFPGLRFVLAHAFFPCDDGYNDTRLNMIRELAADGISCFDISSVFSGEEYPYRNTQKFLRRLCDIVSADRMMWGTDTPCILNSGKENYGRMMTYLREDGLFSSEELEKIYGKTAEKVYFS